MAISGKILAGLSFGAFGLSLMAASGPAGLPVAAALLTGLVIATAIASLVHFAPRMHFGFFPSFGFLHRPWFGGLHSRTFIPAHRPGTTAHTRTFVPATSHSYTPGWGATSRSGSGLGSFGGGGHTVHTGHTFVPRGRF